MPLSEDKAMVAPLLKGVAGPLKMLTKESGGIRLIPTFMRMRVQPLCRLDHPMWEFQGATVSTRPTDVELLKNELVTNVRSVTNLRSLDPCDIDCPVKPYAADNHFSRYEFLFYVFMTASCLY